MIEKSLKVYIAGDFQDCFTGRKNEVNEEPRVPVKSMVASNPKNPE
jgi:methyl coenzyme M reductase subunit C-like uncharacterized protein (methanogenesis marker protein 7)